MKFTVLVDNYVTSSRLGLLGEWGYSALLETDAGSMQIDTGATGTVLLHNMKVLGKAPAKVDNLALSHGHDDHIGGVRLFLEAAPQVKIWASPCATRERYGSVKEFTPATVAGGVKIRELKIAPVLGKVQILPRVYALDVPFEGRDPRYKMGPGLFERNEKGEIQSDTFADDLSFLVEGDKGWSLLLGCAHASLPNIVNRVKELFGVDSFYAIAGGTHMKGLPPQDLDRWLELMKTWRVAHWRLNHCSGFQASARLAALCPEADWAGVGTVMEL